MNTHVQVFACVYVFIFLGVYLGVELLVHVIIYLEHYEELPNCLPEGAVPFYTPTNRVWRLWFSTSSSSTVICFTIAILTGEVVSYCIFYLHFPVDKDVEHFIGYLYFFSIINSYPSPIFIGLFVFFSLLCESSLPILSIDTSPLPNLWLEILPSILVCVFSFHGGMSKLNAMATQYTGSLNGVYHPHWLSGVKSSLFTHMHSSPLSLAARLHRCPTNHFC